MKEKSILIKKILNKFEKFKNGQKFSPVSLAVSFHTPNSHTYLNSDTFFGNSCSSFTEINSRVCLFSTKNLKMYKILVKNTRNIF